MSEPVQPARRRWRRAPVQADLPLPDPGGDDSAPGDGPGGSPLPWWQRRAAVIALAAIAAVALLAAVLARVDARRERTAASALHDELRRISLRPASTERRIRIAPNPQSWSASADAQIRVPDPAELLDLYVPVGYASFNTFAITIDKVDHGRLMVVQRLIPDSNRELRIGLNSSALGPGEYRIRVQGYTWRGQRVDVGWIRLVID
jgi:membrane protein implicated in regulation of membrane protease activity